MTGLTAADRPQPVWRRSPAADPSTRLEGAIEADVAVIGAGFVGLAAALELSRSGRSIAVLEAGELASGASGASAGQVGPLFYGARKAPQDVIGRLGAERGERLNRQVAASGQWLSGMIADHGIDCAFREGLLCVYRSAKGLDRAGATFEQWRAFGGRSERVDRSALARWIASDRYAGGFLLPDGGFLDPVRLIEGMAAAACRAGVRIHTHSRVSTVAKVGGSWVLQAGEGRITADQLLVATGSAGLAAWPDLADTIYPIPCGIAATAPLPDRAESMLPHGGPVADLEDPAIFAPAVTEDGRLLVSFLIGGARPHPVRSPAPARRRLSRVFPGHPVPPFDSFSWGRIAVTPDGLPRLLRGSGGMLAVTGCNGFGLTLGMVAAREVARLIAGAPDDSLLLPVSEPKPLPGPRLVPALFRRVLAPAMNRLGA